MYPRQPSIIITNIAEDAIPTDLYQYSESTLAKFDMVPTIQQQPTTHNPSKWRQDILRHLQILDPLKLQQSLENKR
jgi:hypothetical protein